MPSRQQNKNQSTTDTPLSQADLKSYGDEDLFKLVQEGHRPAFDLITQRYLTKIWRLAFSVLKTEQDADDAVQDVFLKLWKDSKKWQSCGNAGFGTWLYRVALNTCIDLRRAKHRKAETSESKAPELSTQETAFKTLFEKQLSQSMSTVMDKIPEAQRHALFYYYYKDMSVKDISGQMKTTEQAVRSLLKRGKVSLKEAMKSHPALQAIF